LPYGATRWSSGGLPTDRRFTGQREEASLGFYDYGARPYAPALGRFLPEQRERVLAGLVNASAVVPNP